LAELEREQATLENEERHAQEQLRRHESEWNAAQLHYQRTDDGVRLLRHDIEQDLGLVLLEMGEVDAYQPPLPWSTVVEQLAPREELSDGLEMEVREVRARLSRVNNVNPDAPREYAEAASRHDYLLTQSTDLEAAIADLRKIVRELDEVMRVELARTFAAVAEQFVHYFQQLFNGGAAKLVLADPDDITNSGIEIIARPPGKRPQSLALLSGGERTLAALALIFAILRVSPTPFCVLDEVDAALDEANVDRFRLTVEELSQGTQFILITHNRRTLEGTNAIYGITMASDGASRVISLQLQGEKIVKHETSPNDAADASEGDITTFEELVKM
jgi:chromosome segregation protein